MTRKSLAAVLILAVCMTHTAMFGFAVNPRLDAQYSGIEYADAPSSMYDAENCVGGTGTANMFMGAGSYIGTSLAINGVRNVVSRVAISRAATQVPYSGQTVYRVHGGDSGLLGKSWTPVNPRTVPNYRNAAGLPSGGASGVNNTGQFLSEGVLKNPVGITVRPAGGLDGNLGGLREFVVPNPFEQIIIKSTVPINPPF